MYRPWPDRIQRTRNTRPVDGHFDLVVGSQVLDQQAQLDRLQPVAATGEIVTDWQVHADGLFATKLRGNDPRQFAVGRSGRDPAS